jgi:hypothetical protein
VKQAITPEIHVEVVKGGFIITLGEGDNRMRGAQSVMAGNFDELTCVLKSMACTHVVELVEKIKDAPEEFPGHPAIGEEDDDPEPNPDCPPHEFKAYDRFGDKCLEAACRPSPFLGIMERAVELRNAASLDYAQGPSVKAKVPHFDKGQAEKGVASLNSLQDRIRQALDVTFGDYTMDEKGDLHRKVEPEKAEGVTPFDYMDGSYIATPHFVKKSPEDQVHTAARLWRNAVKNLDQSDQTRATSQMRTIIARIEETVKPKGRCMLCNNTGWIARNGGLILRDAPFSQNYVPCPEGCDGGRGFSDPIPYDPKTGKIVTTDTEDDGA